jgi:hypothetical protein
MSAFTPGYAKQLPGFSNQITGIDISTPEGIPVYETLMAADEVITTLDGDYVQQQVDLIQLHLIATPTTTNQDGTTVPFVPPVIPGDTSAINDSMIDLVQMVEGYVDLVSATYAVVHKRVRPWSGTTTAGGKCVTYESSDAGQTFTRRSSYTPMISRYNNMKALRESDGKYVSIFIEQAVVDAYPTIYTLVGKKGGSLAYAASAWTFPYLPVCVACDGTKFVILTSGNRIYNSVDGEVWTYEGIASPALGFSLPSIPNSPYAASGHGVKLQWLPGLAKWALSWPDVISIYFTSDVTAETGWSCTPLNPSIVIADGVTTVYYLQTGGGVVEYAGALFTIGKKDVTSGGATTQNYIIWKSIDGGASWTASYTTATLNPYDSNGPDNPLGQLAILNGNPVCYTLLTSTPYRYQTTDGGATWTVTLTNISMITGLSLKVGPTKVIASVDITVGTPVFKYSLDGITFDDCTIIT